MRMTGKRPTATMMRAASEPCSKLPNVDIDVSHDVGRDRKWQRQQPTQRITAGKGEGGDEPGGAGANDDRHHGDAGKEQRGLRERRRNYIARKVDPEVASFAEGKDDQAGERRDRHEPCRRGYSAEGRGLPAQMKTGRPSIHGWPARGVSSDHQVSCRIRPCPPGWPPPSYGRRSWTAEWYRH